MIKKCSSAGFMEVAHMADWSIKVWAENLDCLFHEAALGMYALMDIQLYRESRVAERMSLESLDRESLLVSFLSELLYKIESQGLAFDQVTVRVNGAALEAEMEGSPITYQKKEIKAVTFHNLAILQAKDKFEVTIVFDV
jgi:SHS2 domain-containing protein